MVYLYIPKLINSWQVSESHIRIAVRAEATRAETAEAALAAAERAAADARNSAAAATAGAQQATVELTTACKQATGLKMQLELSVAITLTI